MEVALIEATEDGKLGQEFQKEVHRQAEGVNFTYKKASDLLNALAYAKKLSGENKIIVLICELSRKKDLNTAFYNALASFQADTGKRVYHLVFEPTEGADIIEFANEFIDAEFDRKRKIEPEDEGDNAFDI